MAGIGFTLRRLTQRDDLVGAVIGYGHSVFISAGPWLLTVLALVGINLSLRDSLNLEELLLFRSIIVYNFSVSLVVTGPVILIATRYLADRVFEKKIETATGLAFSAVLFGTVPGLALATVFYFWICTIDPILALIAFGNYAVISGIWVLSLFLSALKAYARVSLSFALGMASALVLTAIVGSMFGPVGALLGFTAGLSVTLLILLATVLAEYRFPISKPFAMLRYARSHWDLALGGLIYNLAIWIDKWVVWIFGDNTVTVGGALTTAPIYDGAMFLAYLTIVPALALFTVRIETDFFEHYQRFYSEIGDHATLERIRDNQTRVVQSGTSGLRSVLVIQSVITVLVIFLAPSIIEATSGSYQQIGVFRFGTLGALFHVMILFCAILLQYFDARRPALLLQSVFLVANAAFTYLSLELGFAYLGYGYFLATIITFAIGIGLLFNVLRQLPYFAFVRNNPSVTEI
jgi:polysaccharide biosynthesis protein PelG